MGIFGADDSGKEQHRPMEEIRHSVEGGIEDQDAR